MPVFYAVVGAIALVPAVAAAILTRVRWWVAMAGVPVGAMVVAFLWSLATAAGRGRRDVLRRLAPERAWRRDLEEELAGLREQIGGFPLLVPDGWPGEVSLGGCSWSIPPRGSRVLRGVTLVADHGDPQLDPDRHVPGWRPPTPRVEIRVSREVWEAEQTERGRDGSVQVDGVAVTARSLTVDDTDVGVAAFSRDGHDVLLTAEGVDLDALALVQVTDPTPFVDSFERRRRRVLAPSGI